VTGTHPLLNIDNVLHFSIFLASSFIILIVNIFRVGITFKVTPEMLKKCDFLLKIFRILSEGVFFAYILPVARSSLHVVKMMTVRIKDDLGGVIEEHTSCFVRKVITKTILC